MAMLRRQRLLWLFFNSRNARSFIEWMVILPVAFPLGRSLVDALGADEEALSFSFYLCAAADALTKALCLVASISAKGKRQTLDKQTKIRTTGRKKLRNRNLHRWEYVFNL